MTRATTTADGPAARNPNFTLYWALKRFVIGFVILTVSIGGAAWLLYSSIDPEPKKQTARIPAVTAMPAVAAGAGAAVSTKPATTVAAGN